MRRPCSVVGTIVSVIVAPAFIACSDGSSPKPSEPSGRYELVLVGDQGLPHYVTGYLDGSYDEIDNGSLRVLSRGRLVVAATTFRRNQDGSFRFQFTDSITFQYKRSGQRAILTFDDPLGVRTDTLDLVDLGDNSSGLHVRSVNYIRSGWPAPLIAEALYVK